MELSPMSQLRQSGRSRAAITSVPAEKNAQKSGTGPRSDHLSISLQTASYIQEQDRITQEIAKIVERFTANRRSSGMAEEQGGTEDDMLAEELKIKQRCQKIAARIMAGDKVPPQDMQYLSQNDMQTFKLAMAARMMAPKKKPKEWESALEDEDEEDPGGMESGGAESSGTEGAAEASGGGEAGVE